MDINCQDGPSSASLIVRLIDAYVHSWWLCSPRQPGDRVIASMIMASCTHLGADSFMSVHVERHKGPREWYTRRLRRGFSVSELTTLFDWVLQWDTISEIQGAETVFLSLRWNQSVWTRWLFLAIQQGVCSVRLIQSCLTN